MSRITEIDWTTVPPTISERDMTEKELAQVEKDRIEREQYEAARLAEETTKAAQRQAILDRLGLTEEEAQLLLGGK